jgi:trehalose/maltose hydrolase-like predicted phosphorylase
MQGGGKIGEWGEFEQHISGDIVLAARQYWYATADKEWLEEIGFPLAKGVAEFYAKRVTPRAYTVTTRGNTQYDLNDVMGPDEYAFPVNNSAYTNAAAAIALNFATEAAGVLGKHADPTWATVAEGLALTVSDDIPLHPELKGGYHPECTSCLYPCCLPCFA